ncbi:ABC transporter permease [Conexibacter woesei]|uniref:Inner-membrane translocator n=1 Tax=Conexibacter woesei (strain DSM 14684 / CCUG 47730 / CIP 108061 / JCM 11494 / NBRC 100937 / ID131577) TaxID=469383 RepID=D3F9A5_CONWI|nr:ABC transporter permease [Conexibacter woesei]ADB49072.1 inner-membrane translocator [Conexibacter woesei DSM 14684]
MRSLSLPRRRDVLTRAASVGWLVAMALVVIYGLLALSASDPLAATESLLAGPFESPGRVTQWLGDSTNLMLTGLAVALVFRVGQFSIGQEGQVAAGALASGAVLLTVGPFTGMWVVGLLAAMVAGFVWGLIPGLMKAYAGADEIVSSLMLNYVMLLFFSLAVKQWLQLDHAGYPVSDFFAPQAWLPQFGTAPRVSLGLVIAVLLCVGGALFLSRTRLGFEMKTIGANPGFASAVGLRVTRSIWLSMAMSGALAGLAGGVIAQAETHRLIVGLSGGIGYDGIIVALLAASRPLAIPVAALGYGYLRTGGDVAQITSDVPRELVTTVQGVLILMVTIKLTSAGRLLRRVLPPKEPPVASSPQRGQPVGTATAPAQEGGV